MNATMTRRVALQSSAAASILAAAACGSKSEAENAPVVEASSLAYLDAVGTASVIRARDVTPSEVIEAAIQRAEEINPKLNAIVTPYFDAARERAKAEASGPWFGVPTFIKDLNNVIGQRTTYGSRAFANNIAREQSDFVSAYLNTGVISLGKSATPEFGLNATTETSLDGATRNPWNTDYSTGGSSGGAAALVASCVVPVAHASDGGGSIRIPASCCGVVGLKPSSFRFPEPERPSGRPVRIAEHGIEARTVRDIAAFFAMMEVDGPHPKIGLLTRPSGERRKIALYTAPPTGTPVDPEVDAAVRTVGEVLVSLGHEVVEIDPPFPSTVAMDFGLYWASGAAAAVKGWEKIAGRAAGYDQFEPWTFGLAAEYEARRDALGPAIERLKTFAGQWRAAFAEYDIMLSPVLAQPPAPLGYISPNVAFPLLMERIGAYSPYTHFANIAGAPAISLPLGQHSDGLPIGVMAAAVQGGDALLIDLAFELEESMPWKRKTPPVIA